MFSTDGVEEGVDAEKSDTCEEIRRRREGGELGRPIIPKLKPVASRTLSEADVCMQNIRSPFLNLKRTPSMLRLHSNESAVVQIRRPNRKMRGRGAVARDPQHEDDSRRKQSYQFCYAVREGL